MSNTNDFLPQGYSIPTTSKYMKFQNGVNIFRILDKPILGMEYWKTVDGKRSPVRVGMNEPIKMSDLEIDSKTGKPEEVKHFWAMPVWNVNEKKIQILEITQKGIIKAIKSFIENPKWGNPIDYDITVTKSGSGMETEYLIDHDPKEPVSPEIMEQYKSTKIDLQALFRGEDPFKAGEYEQDLQNVVDELSKNNEEDLPF